MRFSILSLTLISILVSFNAFASLKISLLTMSPGPVIFEAFGHSAILVENTEDAGDVRVYEYGNVDTTRLFAQNEMLAALNMLFTETVKTTGKKSLNAPVMKSGFSAGLPIDLHIRYFREKGVLRKIQVNELNLSDEQKTKLIALIETEMPPYQYTYKRFTDNCVTRIRDNVFKVLGEAVSAKLEESAGNLTYREILVDSLNAGASANVASPSVMIFTPGQAKSPRTKSVIEGLEKIGLANEIKPTQTGQLVSDAFFAKIADADKKIASFAMWIDEGPEMAANFHDYFFGEELTKEGMTVRASLFTPKRFREYLLNVVNPETGKPVISTEAEKSYDNSEKVAAETQQGAQK